MNESGQIKDFRFRSALTYPATRGVVIMVVFWGLVGLVGWGVNTIVSDRAVFWVVVAGAVMWAVLLSVPTTVQILEGNVVVRWLSFGSNYAMSSIEAAKASPSLGSLGHWVLAIRMRDGHVHHLMGSKETVRNLGATLTSRRRRRRRRQKAERNEPL